jgi:hypothetical protein
VDPFGAHIPDLQPQDHGPAGRWVPHQLEPTLARMHWEPGTSTEPTARVRSQPHEHGAWTRGPSNFMGWALHEPIHPDTPPPEETTP